MKKELQPFRQVKKTIKNQVDKANKDNLTRTAFYERFYKKHPEIRWSLLAGLVSRNAGWNMTDLANQWFQVLLSEKDRTRLFSIYETGNWTIFDDACPQLLVYEHSKRVGQPLFDLLGEFGVSAFMVQEWNRFWLEHDEERLCTALIINEQHLLESAVIQKKLFKSIISSKLFFQIEQHTHFSYVLLPTIEGQLYTLYVRQFEQVSKRIRLGKQLAYLLFHPDLHQSISFFMDQNPHSGSRRDYFKQMSWSPRVESACLRLVYPKINHKIESRVDWYSNHKNISAYFLPIKEWVPVPREKWVKHKWMMIYMAMTTKKWVTSIVESKSDKQNKPSQK